MEKRGSHDAARRPVLTPPRTTDTGVPATPLQTGQNSPTPAAAPTPRQCTRRHLRRTGRQAYGPNPIVSLARQAADCAARSRRRGPGGAARHGQRRGDGRNHRKCGQRARQARGEAAEATMGGDAPRPGQHGKRRQGRGNAKPPAAAGRPSRRRRGPPGWWCAAMMPCSAKDPAGCSRTTRPASPRRPGPALSRRARPARSPEQRADGRRGEQSRRGSSLHALLDPVRFEQSVNYTLEPPPP